MTFAFRRSLQCFELFEILKIIQIIATFHTVLYFLTSYQDQKTNFSILFFVSD